MLGPGDLSHHHPVLRAAHPRGIGLQKGLEAAQIQTSPAPPTHARVVARALATAPPAVAAQPAVEPDRDDDLTPHLVQCHTTDRGQARHPQQPSQYIGESHAASPVGSVLNSWNRTGDGVSTSLFAPCSGIGRSHTRTARRLTYAPREPPNSGRVQLTHGNPQRPLFWGLLTHPWVTHRRPASDRHRPPSVSSKSAISALAE